MDKVKCLCAVKAIRSGGESSPGPAGAAWVLAKGGSADGAIQDGELRVMEVLAMARYIALLRHKRRGAQRIAMSRPARTHGTNRARGPTVNTPERESDVPSKRRPPET